MSQAPTKVALVTASSAGLGAACVKALAPHCRVVVNYFSRAEKAEAVIKEAEQIQPVFYDVGADQQAGRPRFHAIKADCSQKSEMERLVRETVEVMGRIDIIVSNAGWTRFTNFMNLDEQVREEDWDRCYNVNVKCHLWLLYAAKPHFDKNPEGGSFVSVASLAGVRPSGSSLPYSVSKAAQLHLIRGLATICGKSVRCNSVSPGLLLTEWGSQFPEDVINANRERSALKSVATVEDVAEQVKTFSLSKSITGQNLVIDCGIAI
ncbi:short chain dehydrogenase [Microdochium trichocladiopsis]|uniref:Short chain dehydrogenase n=1 Tax=Microdochium trichocladiopsis TaxID=1682393 RepID=A0A9P9BTB8_9PEZI|nr:short chain dehydrogenase [Microdochium trichocladiopsis]KAH7035459.1 short chain dehydrogenase [Microdochium trichocladiopsis]